MSSEPFQTPSGMASAAMHHRQPEPQNTSTGRETDGLSLERSREAVDQPSFSLLLFRRKNMPCHAQRSKRDNCRQETANNRHF